MPAESGSPASDLGNHQWLRLPSGSLYEYFGGLRYRMSSEGKHRVEMYAGLESCIRVFRPAGSENAEAILFVPTDERPGSTKETVRDGLLERLGVIETRYRPLSYEGLRAIDGLSDKCTVFPGTDGWTTVSPLFKKDLHDFIRQYAGSLEVQYVQEGERSGGKSGLVAGGLISAAVHALAIAGMSELKLENITALMVSAVSVAYLGGLFGKWAGGRSARNHKNEIFHDRLSRGHENEANLYHVAKFIRNDLQQFDKPLEHLDGAFRQLASVPSGNGLMIRWQNLPYDKIIERCEMLLGVKPARYLGSRLVEQVSVPSAPVAHEPIHVEVPASSLEVKVKGAAAPSKCPHCSDSLREGDRCITGMLVGTPTQAHADCSGEMIESLADWKPISGEYAYESLVDQTTSQSDKNKEERRVKE